MPCVCVRQPGDSHLIQAVIEQNDLRLLAARTLSDQHVPRVRVAVDEAVDKDHFTVHFTQIL